MKSLIARFRKDQSGTTAIEYALLTGLVALAVIPAVRLVGTSIGGVLNRIATELGGS